MEEFDKPYSAIESRWEWKPKIRSLNIYKSPDRQ